MSRLKMVEVSAEQESKQKLQSLYDKGLIPAEKKPFLTRIENAFGPFIATNSGELILDASSQIATMALGFSASALFGVVHHLESWTNRDDTSKIKDLRMQFRDFLERKLNWPQVHMFLCNSGSEANEIALGDCYRTRKNINARKVLAFEGSFHGRMLLALASTWNPAKRQHYEWPDYTSCFVNFPEMKGDLLSDPGVPQNWISTFASASRKDFPKKLNQLVVEDGCHEGLFEAEKNSLMEVRNQLISGEIFAIMVEPIQCEGGDRYASKRFYVALANMARAFQVPLIFDEVQTGFGLGGDFFWHQLFDLEDPDGIALYPDYVVCAKKAQVGMVLSHRPIPFDECYSVHSFIRGCLQGWMVDQLENEIHELELKARVLLNKIVQEFAEYLHSPRARGLSFSFDFYHKEDLDRFIAYRFEYGMLYYPAGSHTARFRLNTGFNDKYLELLFNQIRKALRHTFRGIAEESSFENLQFDNRYSLEFHLLFSKLKLNALNPSESAEGMDIENHISDLFELALGKKHAHLNFEILQAQNYPLYRDRIAELQKLVYEPVRQTSLSEFDQALISGEGFGVIILDQEKLVGLSVCCPLEVFEAVPGIRNSPNFDQGNCLYSVDITLNADYRGGHLGRFLKYSQLLQAMQAGYHFIEGRNRDRLASQMLNHNFSVGALPVMHMSEDYKDSDEYRDCIYYQTDLRWQPLPLSLSRGIGSPWGMQVSRKHLRKDRQGIAVNKMCLSNFLSEAFLEDIELIADQYPEAQRHVFTASGQSECLDKAIKTIWKFRKVQRVLCLRGTYFGHGSVMARSIGLPEDGFYPVDFVPNPFMTGEQEAIQSLENALASEEYLAFCVEPLMQKSMQRLSLNFLKQVSRLCKNKGVPIISNDTASAFHRYSEDSFAAGPLFDADVSVLFMGGQMGLVLAAQDWFVTDPLALISTWDGDEHTLQLYTQYLRHHLTNKLQISDQRTRFNDQLTRIFKQQEQLKFELNNGFGWAHGPLEHELASLMDHTLCDGRYLIIPDDDSMAEYLRQYGS